MYNKKFFYYIMFICLFFAQSIANSYEMSNEKKAKLFEQNIQTINHHAVQFLNTSSLSPYINKDYKFQPIGIEHFFISHNDIIQGFVLGEISDNAYKHKIVFLVSINVKTNKVIDTQFLYIGNTFISGELFADILPIAAGASGLNLNDAIYIYIKNLNNKNKNYEWVFFNQNTVKKLNVTLIPDGKGGNYFTIN